MIKSHFIWLEFGGRGLRIGNARPCVFLLRCVLGHDFVLNVFECEKILSGYNIYHTIYQLFFTVYNIYLDLQTCLYMSIVCSCKFVNSRVMCSQCEVIYINEYIRRSQSVWVMPAFTHIACK